MQRKTFLTSCATAFGGVLFPFNNAVHAIEKIDPPTYIIPPYLKAGDTVGITSPAGFITKEQIEPAILQIQSWGYKVNIGQAIGRRDFTRGGTDEERAADFQQMIDDPDIKAIMCARGGYGSLGMVDKVDWKKFIKNPKWIIGFSDITILHNHIHRTCKVASIHSKMCNSFPDDWNKAEPIQRETINSIGDSLAGIKMKYSATPGIWNKQGEGRGVLTGGNLKTIETLSGTKSDIDTRGKILFVEDTGEYLYSLDRMFWHLKRTGKLDALQGLIVGGFNIKDDDAGDEFGRTLEEIVLNKVKEFNYPVCFNFPVGHQRANFAFKCGIRHRLSVNADAVTLQETA
jgi:muramoyltetrapeptide carboxypeptidase